MRSHWRDERHLVPGFPGDSWRSFSTDVIVASIFNVGKTIPETTHMLMVYTTYFRVIWGMVYYRFTLMM